MTHCLTSRFKQCLIIVDTIVGITQHQNGIRRARSNITLINPVICHSIYPWTSLLNGSLQHSFGYNTDDCLTPTGHFCYMSNFVHTFYSRYNTNWITDTLLGQAVGLDPNNSVIKRLWRIIVLNTIGFNRKG